MTLPKVTSQTIPDGVLAIAFEGSYPPGSRGRPVAEWMVEHAAMLAHDPAARAIVIDLRAFAYEWGDEMEWIYDVGRSCDPAIPQATVVSDANRRALSTLEWGLDTKQDITELPYVFDSVEEAIAFVSAA